MRIVLLNRLDVLSLRKWKATNFYNARQEAVRKSQGIIVDILEKLVIPRT